MITSLAILTTLVTNVLYVTSSEYPSLDVILEEGVKSKVYPGAVALIGSASRGVLYTKAVGSYHYADEVGVQDGNPPMTLDTIFDVASVSKVVATTSAVAMLYQQGHIALEDKVSKYLGASYEVGGKENITIQNCLLHNSGYAPDPVPWYWDATFGCPNSANYSPEEDFSCLDPLVMNSLLAEQVEQPTGEKYTYSDLGFITLAMITGRVAYDKKLVPSSSLRPFCQSSKSAGTEAPTTKEIFCHFEAYVRLNVFDAVKMPHTKYIMDENEYTACAPTINDTVYTHKRIQGQVSDGNTYAMGGISGHAGVFSTVEDLGNLLHYLLLELSQPSEQPVFLNATTIKLFTTAYDLSFSSRGLGWTTNSDMVKDYGYDNSCGAMSTSTFMHIGYTGTCVCADPINNLYSVVLTTRVYNCEGQSCDSNHTSDAVKSVYRQLNTEAMKLFVNSRQ